MLQFIADVCIAAMFWLDKMIHSLLVRNNQHS